MDEYEKLEKDLVRHYEGYLERFRNLDFLENELDMYHKVQTFFKFDPQWCQWPGSHFLFFVCCTAQSEQEKLEENERSLKRMQKKLRDDELRNLRGEMVRFLFASHPVFL